MDVVVVVRDAESINADEVEEGEEESLYAKASSLMKMDLVSDWDIMGDLCGKRVDEGGGTETPPCCVCEVCSNDSDSSASDAPRSESWRCSCLDWRDGLEGIHEEEDAGALRCEDDNDLDVVDVAAVDEDIDDDVEEDEGR